MIPLVAFILFIGYLGMPSQFQPNFISLTHCMISSPRHPHHPHQPSHLRVNPGVNLGVNPINQSINPHPCIPISHSILLLLPQISAILVLPTTKYVRRYFSSCDSIFLFLSISISIYTHVYMRKEKPRYK